MIKLSTWANEFVAVACVMAVYCGGFIAWRAWQTFRKFDSIADKFDSVAHSLREIMLIQNRQQEWAEAQDAAELAASQNRVNAVAMNIVFDNIEIFPADPQTREIGIGVFKMRNVGNDSVFLLGITRTAEEEMPPGPVRLLTPLGDRDLDLRLDPDDPPLDLAKATVWYRDLRGQHWVRSYGDRRASQLPEAPAAVEQPAAEQVTAEHAAGELPVSGTDSASGTDSHE